MPIQNEFSSDNGAKYLSLREAAQIYGYTRDHLGLMIRRDKLQSVRLGNYYVTTIKWMDEYILKFSDPKTSSKNKFSNKFRTSQKPNISQELPKEPIKNTNIKYDDPFSELQKNIAGILSSRPQIKTANKTTEFLPSGPVEEHGLVILPVRKMKDFERQMIISQAKNQEND